MPRLMKRYDHYSGETLTYAVDWSDFLEAENDGAGDTIATSNWAITPSGELTASSPSVDTGNTRSLVSLAGGNVNTRYTVTNTITLTTTDQTVIAKFLVEVS